MNVHEVNPYIRLAMHSVLQPHINIKRRIIFDYELIYVESGEFDLFYHDRVYRVTAGNFIFIRPGISHEFILGDVAVSQPHIHFDITYSPDSEDVPVSFKDLEKLSDSERRMIRPDLFFNYPKEPFVRFNDKDTFFDLFYSILSHSTGSLSKKGKLTELLGILVSDNFQGMIESGETPSIAKQIKCYIDAGQGLTLSLDDFSLFFSYSKFHLDKSFKKAFGTGLIEYRNAKRMEFARKLLGHLSVSEVSERIGYSSIYAFSRAYKNHFGCSPRNHLSHQ